MLADVYMYTNQITNVFLIGNKEHFVLVDAGMPKSGETLIAKIKEHFGDAKPRAILLTHGHFDHVGGLMEMVKEWNVPVYAHEMELPFLTGKQRYPEPDPSVEGGMIAKISSLFPNEPIDLKNHVQPLPSDGSVPHMEGFRWLHTPGHSPGHFSYFRDSDKTLIAGDAFVTVRQDKLYKVLKQEKEVSGPPRYFTTDWVQAKQSVHILRDLHPVTAVTGHGVPVVGEELTRDLEHLAVHFDQIAVPDHGKYVDGEKN